MFRCPNCKEEFESHRQQDFFNHLKNNKDCADKTLSVVEEYLDIIGSSLKSAGVVL